MNIFTYEMKNFSVKWNISYMKLGFHIWKVYFIYEMLLSYYEFLGF